MKKFRKIANYAAVGGLGAMLITGLNGCGNSNNNEEMITQETQQGAFVIIEETTPGKYKIQEEFPSKETRIVLKDINGTERVLTKEEMDVLMAEENAKIDAGTSPLTNQNAQLSSGGLSLGEAILASAAGAIIGSWIGSKLFNNTAYNNHRQTAYKNPSTYSRSVDSFNKAKATSSKSSTSKKSGFFSGGSKTGTSSGSFGS
ncbi:hypothetical protein CSPB12327_05155 [Campylobacter sp. RM12327]|uniref:UPF0323 family lipoprotein n=2 Tax=Campylobacter sputorum TaxID=206 RepID=UPI000B798F4B|nr:MULTISPECIES: UPF0323 family lipoprotein [Campylobacter]ASM39432.1 putative lipoprotein [Campylobacter sputorum]MBE7358234.1 hypothetical protein [Campylobacter sp. RM11302]MBF6669526.1 hypothetical protein [Campylobacter sp. RM12327]MBF6674235.1 hypothetical protein [Campylobacter sp. RM13538]MBF6678032.1 hypothetical protein [Campylobacter sp. RM11259]